MRLRLNLKVKVTLGIGCLLVISIGALGWIALIQVEESALRRLHEKGVIVAEGLAARAELGVFTSNAEMLQGEFLHLAHETDLVYAGVADARGSVLAEWRPGEIGDVPGWAHPIAAGAAPDGEPLVTTAGRDRAGTAIYYVTSPIRAQGGGLIGAAAEPLAVPRSGEARGALGLVCIGVSAAGVDREVRGLRHRLMVATLAVLAVGLAITVLLVRVIVRPVRELAEATERIAAGDLEVRLPRPGHDEIGALAGAFKRMTLNLGESRQALERSHAELERKVLERTRALEEAQNRLIQAEKMTVVGQLVSGVAHELNNPLAGVLGYAQLLLRKGVPDEAAHGLRKIEAEAERCRRIVQNLLIFARKHKPQRTLLDLNAVIESTLELRAYQLRVDNVTVVRDLDPRLPRTLADMHQIQQVLMNMVNNAQHAMAATAAPRLLTVRTRQDGGRIAIQVIDNGSGIAPDNLGKIFDPFFTTKEVGHGTGLGLSICYGIVQEHGGEIRVDSAPGSGTTFTIDLPIAGPGPREAAGAEPAPDGAALPARRGRILLVDDERTILDVLGDVLRLDGHEVEATSNGAAALGKVRQGRFDLILSDLKMPGMSGHELFERIRGIDAALCRRLIFTTGDLASPDTLAFLERTGNPYLQKPFDLQTVRRMVQEMLAAGAAAAS